VIRSLTAVLTLACLIACNQAVRRSQVSIQELPLRSIVVSGFINRDAVNRALLLSEENGWTLPIEFKNCEGGELGASVRLANEIRQRNMSTRADGYVASGCAHAYLAGTSRVQVEKSNLMLHFHAPSHAGKPMSPEKVAELMNQLEIFTDGRFPGRWRSAISSRFGDAGVFFVSTLRGGRLIQEAMICNRRALATDKLSDVCPETQPISFEVLGLTTAR
jgi:hypothetical protein